MPITPNKANVQKLLTECGLTAADVAPYMRRSEIEMRSALSRKMGAGSCIETITAIRRAAHARGIEIIENAAVTGEEFTIIRL